ncbi:hypothetical protein DSM104329_04477 [Capillimicrobium parvum]|uniref:Uncharacterized protein n=1 Tax=Capillimicrobium parvum TaxID=2884022 RepID=A0A9E7C207_9ACTN|nr:hypothetical protein DSM104329_04477 [Capillimicrobium parvum]
MLVLVVAGLASAPAAHATTPTPIDAGTARTGTAPAAHATTPTSIDAGTARTVSTAFANDCGACQATVADCAQVTSRRADCVVAEEGDCSFVVASRVDLRGYLYYDVYPCRPDAPPTAEAQVRKHPAGRFFEPLTPAAFEFASDVYPTRLPYPAFPVRHYHGTTSQRETFDLWITPGRLVLTGSGVPFDAACWPGPAFLRLGREHVTRKGRISSRRAHANADTPAHRLDARLTDHRRRVTGTLRLRDLRCRRAPIRFTGRRVGGPGFGRGR